MSTIKIMYVQPIELSFDCFKRISKTKLKNSYFKEPNIKWISNFNSIHNRSKHFISILSENNFNPEILKKDLNSKNFSVFNKFSLSENLIDDSIYFDLIYDKRLSSITLVIELSFSIDDKKLETLLSDTKYDEKKINLYNTVRNLLVKENDNSEISKWGDLVINKCLHKIGSLFFNGKDNTNNYPKIENNTGNITFLINNILPENKDNFKDIIYNSNQMAERIEKNRSEILNTNDISFVFHGRFHSIITDNKEYYYRLFPIQYQAQFMWYNLHSFTTNMDFINRNLLLGNYTTSKNISTIDEYINKFELLRIHNQDMRMYFETDHELVYFQVEKKWSIKDSLDEVNNYISSFKEFSERTYRRKVDKSNQRQNKILFTISCIQMLGLVSIWVDYLSLSKNQSFINSTGFIRNSKNEFILHFNTWFPILLLVFLFILVYKALFKD